MSRMIFDLTEEDRAALERIRITRGLRSHAETLRAMIRGEDGQPAMVEPPAPRPSFSHGRSKTVLAPAKRERTVPAAHVDVPVYEAKPFNPQPKTGKKR
jgi:hypothetical protein